MLWLIVLLVSFIKNVTLPFMGAAVILFAGDLIWIIKTTFDVVKPHFGGVIYA